MQEIKIKKARVKGKITRVIEYVDILPKGFQILKNQVCVPKGFKRIDNGLSLFNPNYKSLYYLTNYNDVNWENKALFTVWDKVKWRMDIAE